MTTKEWLGRAISIDSELEALYAAREKMIDQMTKATQTLSGDVVQSTKDPHVYDSLGELALEIKRSVKQSQQIKSEVLSAISKVQNTSHRVLLTLRYVDGLSWEEVAVRMHYSYRHACRVHGRALIEISEVLKHG